MGVYQEAFPGGWSCECDQCPTKVGVDHLGDVKDVPAALRSLSWRQIPVNGRVTEFSLWACPSCAQNLVDVSPK